METKRTHRTLNLIVMVALAMSWLPLTSATAASEQGAPAAQMLPIATLLNPDGTLNTLTGASGALDLRGWNVMLDPACGPILTHAARGPAAPNIVRTWSPLAHKGLNNFVSAFAVSGSDLYVGGNFSATFDGGVTALWKIARYSSGVWSPLAHNGLNDYVTAMAMMGSDLYVGGYFTQTIDGKISLNHIARYSGGAWFPLANNGLDDTVEALAVMGSDLYVGGIFSKTADGKVKGPERYRQIQRGCVVNAC